jgi:hypothetical protein
VFWLRVSAVAVVVAFATAGCGSGGNSTAEPGYPLVTRSSRLPAPSLALSDAREQRGGLRRGAGYAIVVNLDVSGTLASEAEKAALASAAGKAGAAVNARFVSVLEDGNSLRHSQFVVQGHVIAYPNDTELEQSKQARLLAATGLPTCLVVDRRGRVAARIVGLVDPARLIATIRAVVAES